MRMWNYDDVTPEHCRYHKQYDDDEGEARCDAMMPWPHGIVATINNDDDDERKASKRNDGTEY